LVLEVFVKLLIAIAVGSGVTLATFASLLLGSEKLTSFDQFAEAGPPPVEAILSAGAGLLALAIALILFSVGPLGKKRWFVTQEHPHPHEALPPEEPYHGEL
jgi:hypothetical protein